MKLNSNEDSQVKQTSEQLAAAVEDAQNVDMSNEGHVKSESELGPGQAPVGADRSHIALFHGDAQPGGGTVKSGTVETGGR